VGARAGHGGRPRIRGRAGGVGAASQRLDAMRCGGAAMSWGVIGGCGLSPTPVVGGTGVPRLTEHELNIGRVLEFVSTRRTVSEDAGILLIFLRQVDQSSTQ
jgi:hypothetical protein